MRSFATTGEGLQILCVGLRGAEPHNGARASSRVNLHERSAADAFQDRTLQNKSLTIVTVSHRRSVWNLIE